jgi:uncharacterized membrane protein YbhN (UPF0104 family)
VAVLVLAMVWRALARNWSEFRSLHVTVGFRAGWLALAAGAVFLTYAIQILSWRGLLAGWGQRLRYGAAARIWLLVNLARYVPGKVWGLAGMVLLSQRAGVEPWAASASAVAALALVVGTAVAVVAAAVPAAASPLPLGVAALAAAAPIAALAWERPARWLANLAGLGSEFRPLPARALAASGSLTLVAWITYGLAFWLLALGLGLPATLSLPTAVGVFALGYVAGLLTFFAPGGVGVRELALIGLLTPTLGSGGAVTLSVGSRVFLTLMEAAAAAVVLVLTGRGAKDTGAAVKR